MMRGDGQKGKDQVMRERLTREGAISSPPFRVMNAALIPKS
jgi:hypothetical protein